jgi:hypothetical protein
MRILKDLRIDEVSCVIKGANPGATVMIRKSDTAQAIYDRRRRAAERIMAALEELAEYPDESEAIKKDTQMPQVDILKLISVTEEGLMAQAKLSKKAGQSDAQAFSKLFESDVDFRKSWATVTEAKHLLALKSYPGMMRTDPAVIGGEAALAVNDPAVAARELQKLVEEQRKLAPTLTTSQLYDRVYADPANRTITERAHRRPTTSSTSGSELQR